MMPLGNCCDTLCVCNEQSFLAQQTLQQIDQRHILHSEEPKLSQAFPTDGLHRAAIAPS
jgi:hypothetical protein